MTASSEVLQRVSCIWYLIQFQRNEIQVLINSGSEINAMTPAYTAKLGLEPRPTNVSAQKIDDSVVETYGMAWASFLLQDSLRRIRFFDKTFLLADTSMKVVLGMSFLVLSNANF